MKAVLMSIQPKWCELIASGKKTIEVRKTRPKIETPFKSYIYCTHNGGALHSAYDGLHYHKSYVGKNDGSFINGTVIGEFVCKAILPISITYSDPDSKLALRDFPFTCLTDKDIMDYLGNGKTGYGWHISDLKIYETPKELSDFSKLSDCHRGIARENCVGCWDCEITRPPQSWCYVEELQG